MIRRQNGSKAEQFKDKKVQKQNGSKTGWFNNMTSKKQFKRRTV